MGATLHAITHVEIALAASNDIASQQSDTDGRLDHCTNCDMWKALGCVLPTHPPTVHVGCVSHCYFISPARLVDIARLQWFMQRAPPRSA